MATQLENFNMNRHGIASSPPSSLRRFVALPPSVASSLRRFVASAASSPARSAFTLTEVIIAVAIALLILLGVNVVFRSTAATIGAGNALTEAIRSHKAVFSVLEHDIHGFTEDATTGIAPMGPDDEVAPFLYIDSRRVAAFRDRAEMEADNDYDRDATAGQREAQIRSIDTTGDGTDDLTIPRTIYGHRNYRIDRIAFFARGEFPRQTANENGGFAADLFSNEAWIWIGHLKQPHDADDPDWVAGSNYFNPGEDTATENRHNFFASDWSLGRIAMLLIPPDGENRIYDAHGNPQRYIGRSPGAATTQLTPLNVNSQTTEGGDPYSMSEPRIQNSRYDLAGTNMAQYRQFMLNHQLDMDPAEWSIQFQYRFQANPFPMRPYSSTDMGRISPILLRHCSQFIVEYAGNYLTQSPDGHVELAEPDPAGTLDFVVVDDQRQIRWYGFPRDVNGDGVIPGRSHPDFLNSPDVLPLRDVRSTAVIAPPSAEAPFEHRLPVLRENDYVAQGVLIDDFYRLGWGPLEFDADLAPALIRVIVTVIDPRGRLPDGVTKEYVFKTR